MSHPRDHTAHDHTRLVSGFTLLVAVGLPVAAILTAGLRDVAVRPGMIDWVFVAGVAALTVVTFASLARWLGRRPQAPTGGAGLAFAVVALLATPVAFWTMVPVILGSAGGWLGYRAASRDRGRGRRAGFVALAVGPLTALASVALYVATS